jgi:hypothetical protein
MGLANRAIVAGGLGFAVSVLAACGSSGGLLSPGEAVSLSGQLQQVAQALSVHSCAAAANDISSFRNTVDSLGSVNSTLVSNLDQGASTIAELTSRECPSGQSTATTPPAKTTTTKTTTTPTVTTSTVTTPTVTTSTTGGAGLGNSGSTGSTGNTGASGSTGAGSPNGNGNGNGDGGAGAGG